MKARVGAQQTHAAGSGPADAGDELIDKAVDAALGVGRPLAQAQVQHLAAVGARGKDRVKAALTGVPNTAPCLA